jgi:hypothetical protein
MSATMAAYSPISIASVILSLVAELGLEPFIFHQNGKGEIKEDLE